MMPTEPARPDPAGADAPRGTALLDESLAERDPVELEGDGLEQFVQAVQAMVNCAAADSEGPGEILLRVEAPRLPARPPSRRRRAFRTVLVGALIAGCAALPWLAPGLPQRIADLVPGQHAAPVHIEDPKVAPARGFVGPLGIRQQAGTFVGSQLKAAGKPRQVRVSRLHVDSAVVPISGQSGSLLPPSDPQMLGWWREGQQVGARNGTAVITGHTVHTGGGAFDQLDKLVVGDSIRVRTDAGWIRYVVQRTRIYSTAELARDAESIFRQDGPGRLVLVTCDNWNGESYESNAVVFAAPVADQPLASDGTTPTG
jgi:LPXTG-site transpeptidase (sortase) family protein